MHCLVRAGLFVYARLDNKMAGGLEAKVGALNISHTSKRSYKLTLYTH